MSEIVAQARSVATITAEIRVITAQARKMMLTAAVEIGERLLEAKEMVPHGEWAAYLQNEVEFSQSTAQNFMKLAKEYGTGGKSLFENSKSQTFGNLSYSQALRLLALPEDAREEFVEAHDVESMSTREIEKAVKELAEEKAAREKAEQEAAAARDGAAKLQRDLERAKKSAEESKATAENAVAAAAKTERKLQEAKAAEAAARDELRKAQESPTIPEATMEAMRREAELAALESTRKETEKELAAMRAKVAKAEEAAARYEIQAEDAKKALAMATPDAAVFKAAFTDVQAAFQRMAESLAKVRGQDPETAKKLEAATVALLEKMKGVVQR